MGACRQPKLGMKWSDYRYLIGKKQGPSTKKRTASLLLMIFSARIGLDIDNKDRAEDSIATAFLKA